jgi:hypothetical protein
LIRRAGASERDPAITSSARGKVAVGTLIPSARFFPKAEIEISSPLAAAGDNIKWRNYRFDALTF